MKKRILIGIGILIATVLFTWVICETYWSDYYNYSGYITDVYENENGETVIAALSGTSESLFTIKWYTRKAAPRKQPVAVGDRIMLSTTHFSDTNIKQMKISPGYSTEGKVIYTDELYTPFVLATTKETGVRYLVSMIRTPEGLKTGDTVRFYHATPVYTSTLSVVAESTVVIAEGSINTLTAEDIAFVKSKGYKIK